MGSLTRPDVLSVFGIYRSVIQASADREPAMYRSATLGEPAMVTYGLWIRVVTSSTLTPV